MSVSSPIAEQAPKRPTRQIPVRRVLSALMSVAIVVGIFYFFLPQFADISSVWSAIADMTPLEVGSLAVAAVWPEMQAGVLGAVRPLLRGPRGPANPAGGVRHGDVSGGERDPAGRSPGMPKGPRRRPVRGDEAWVRSSGRLVDANSGTGPEPSRTSRGALMCHIAGQGDVQRTAVADLVRRMNDGRVVLDPTPERSPT